MDVDSIDKIVTRYFACVTDEPFTYKGKTYKPRPLHISPLILRGYTCPAMCGACCTRFSLDYLPQERRPDRLDLKERLIKFDGREVPIWSDMQDDHDSHHCRNLAADTGRCNIHGEHPFSCDFELIRFLHFADPSKPNMLTQKLYGRGHAMLRIDGERGALCEMLPSNDERKAEVVRKLGRLKQWCEHFKLKHRVDQIIAWVNNPTDEGITLPPSNDREHPSIFSERNTRMEDNGTPQPREHLNGKEPKPKRKPRQPNDEMDREPVMDRHMPALFLELDPSDPPLDGDEEVREFAIRIHGAWRKTLKSVLETGRLLIEAKAKLGHGRWLNLFHRLDFGERKAQYLMAIAEHPVLSDPQTSADLPVAWTTLAELTGLEPDTMRHLIANGSIHRRMTLTDAKMCAGWSPTVLKLGDLLKGLEVIAARIPPEKFAALSIGEALLVGNYWSTLDPLKAIGEWLLECHRLANDAYEARGTDRELSLNGTIGNGQVKVLPTATHTLRKLDRAAERRQRLGAGEEEAEADE